MGGVGGLVGLANWVNWATWADVRCWRTGWNTVRKPLRRWRFPRQRSRVVQGIRILAFRLEASA